MNLFPRLGVLAKTGEPTAHVFFNRNDTGPNFVVADARQPRHQSLTATLLLMLQFTEMFGIEQEPHSSSPLHSSCLISRPRLITSAKSGSLSNVPIVCRQAPGPGACLAFAV